MFKGKIISGCWDEETIELKGMPKDFILSARQLVVLEVEEYEKLQAQIKGLEETLNVYHNIAYNKNIPHDDKITVPEFIRIAIKNKFECGEHFVVYENEFHKFSIAANSYYCVWNCVYNEKNCETYHEDLTFALKRKTTIQQPLKESE